MHGGPISSVIFLLAAAPNSKKLETQRPRGNCLLAKVNDQAIIQNALKEKRLQQTQVDKYNTLLQKNNIARLCDKIPLVRSRLLADQRILSVLAIEIFLGCALTLLADFNARGDKFLSQIDFVVANQLLITITNTLLVLALSPSVNLGPLKSGKIATFTSRLPAYVLQKGVFSPVQRLACFFLNASLFCFLGAIASSMGQGLVMGLVRLRSTISGKAPSVELAPILVTAVNYALFMAVSSNTRYQTVNSLEGNMMHLLPASTRVPISVILRTLNNYLGSASWIWWARFRGLQ